MKELYKLLLAISATSWVIVFYGVKEEWSILTIPSWIFGVLLFFIPILLSLASILMTSFLNDNDFKGCAELEEADSSFLPTYLGYFFVGLGADKFEHLVFVYVVILIFAYLSQARYFNPLFLLFGYRFYNAETNKKTRVFIIVKRDLQNPSEVNFDNLKRINDTTFIERKKRGSKK